MTVIPLRRPRSGPARAPVLLVGLLLVAGPSATGCVAAPPTAPSTGVPLPGVPTAATATFGGTDAAWIQLMIPMNEQALAALDLVPGRSTDEGVRELAGRIAADRRTELDDLRRLRGRAGLPAVNEHEGHDLPGMVVPADLVALRSLHGPAFDHAIGQTLREHVEQGARLADAERANGSDAQTRGLAERVGRTRATELGWLTGAPATG
ncbi:DUF305 domain-containing protein [Micromonospora rubida]|uniref:DUF305 domain-containing protein n=1 Tax=Micromonospora rubida TaxID=2697657 RepID=UPI001377D0ED|nr:DUF305 domain-containing protein [Micromonospora rubida]NBE84095.1 DUF305 domain-containing protein [Micromonospora rubida]